MNKFLVRSWQEQVIFEWDDDVCFILDQQSEFDSCSTSPYVYMAPLRHIILTGSICGLTDQGTNLLRLARKPLHGRGDFGEEKRHSQTVYSKRNFHVESSLFSQILHSNMAFLHINIIFMGTGQKPL